MSDTGHGFIAFTGATAALRGHARLARPAFGKSRLRTLGQPFARELHPMGIHAIHVIIDGQHD